MNNHTPLQIELARSSECVIVQTKYGRVKGGRAANGAAVFLEIPYARPPLRFTDPEPLPPGFLYEDKDYIKETSYCFQPRNDGQVAHIPFVDKVGLGEPVENPLFVNIICPPSFPSNSGSYPVKFFIHGGALQFGSPHNLNSSAQYISAERSEVWVTVGYRLSVFGFLACDEPRLDGNYGFKDQWLGLQWVKDNISSFGGNPEDIQVIGLSSGAHSVHQILHHVSRLPDEQRSPFKSAMLQSNAILTNPKSSAELRPQFQALCQALNLDPDSADVLDILRDPQKVPPSVLTHLIETDALGKQYGTFRGCLDGDWMANKPDPMTWQRSGIFAQKLREKGVKSIIVGDLSEEWYTFSLTYPTHSPHDVQLNLERFYPQPVVSRMLEVYEKLSEDAGTEQSQKLFGRILSDGQVHLPVRILARDLLGSGFPVLRYEIRWTPENGRTDGYCTHGTDRDIWMLYLPALNNAESTASRAWIDAIYTESDRVEKGDSALPSVRDILTLKDDKTIAWTADERWDELTETCNVLIPTPGRR